MRKLVIILILLSLPIVCSAKVVRHKKVVNYSDPDVSKEVNTLRKFRDFELKTRWWGKEFVNYYYAYGPVAANAISKRNRLKSLVRLILLPLMYAGRNFKVTLIILKSLGYMILLTTGLFLYLKLTKNRLNIKEIEIIYESS